MQSIKRFFQHQSIAILALLMACGGTSYAATQLAAGSVGTKQLKVNAVTSPKIKNGQVTQSDLGANAVTTDKVRNGTLTAADFGPGVLGSGRVATLRAGETIRGQLTGDFDAPSASTDWKVSASFPIPLANPPGATYVDGVTTGETCTGSYAAPTAPPNTLCVYLGVAFNPTAGVETHAVGEASPWGFQLGWVNGAPGDTYAWTRWAFTEG